MATSFRYDPYKMRHKAVFYTVGERLSKSGVTIPAKNKAFTLHYAQIKITLNQRFYATGQSLKGTVIIAVRHNNIDETMQVELKDGMYSIYDISRDSDDYIAYDLITLKRINKAGKAKA
ncbi:phage head closure protein [Limosilactobacillus reuteri]|uniref:phage head closure protein n=1 Tax=Limosilactobacillus reuteri TaxID=1598 RepID=UPI001E3EE83C|nr:phage head closure protein [Limosilactobacillus reuteri]MCC4501835.1 phage head closure protein [Limosilactobacillus reuteri]